MSRNAFFIDPFCDVIPCNGMAKKAVMGNLREQSWEELWNSKQAQEVVCLREKLRQKLLDDRIGISGDASLYLGAGMVGCEA